MRQASLLMDLFGIDKPGNDGWDSYSGQYFGRYVIAYSSAQQTLDKVNLGHMLQSLLLTSSVSMKRNARDSSSPGTPFHEDFVQARNQHHNDQICGAARQLPDANTSVARSRKEVAIFSATLAAMQELLQASSYLPL